jgi:hypothetical protein
MKIKIFEPPLPSLDVEQMSNGGEVEPAKMFGGGNIGNFSVNIDPERVAEYMANNPVVADTVGQAAPQRVVASPTPEEVDAFNYMYGPSASEAMGFNVEQGAYGNDYAQYDRGDYVRSTDPAAAAERAAEAERRRQERQAQREADAAAEAEAEAARVAAAEAEFARRISAGELTAQEIQDLIAGGVLTEDQVLAIIQNYQLSEDQLAQLYTQGLLTQEQILELVEGEVADQMSESEGSADGIASGLTEDQINELIAQGLADQDMTGYATTEDITGLENLFQNYLTADQLEGYVTADQLAEATDYDTTIQALTDQLGELETKYQDVTSQYEADAVNQQISDTKDELNNYFAASAPSGPRTGSTSQFSSGTSFLPGGSPMATLIEGQREGQGQDPFTSYLKTFTPSYSEYNEPFTPEEYNERNQPFTGGMYNNPFTGGMSYNPDKKNMGGQVSNGIMDLTNFDTNVQPFQNAFRPNVPRN